MKWFKHFSDNHRGQSVQALLDELGHTGLCYYLLVEMCAEKLDPKVGSGLTDSDCLFRFHQRIVRQNLRISATNLRRLLGVCGANGLLSFEFSGNTLEISMPILLDLLDSDSKKARSRRASAAAKSRLDLDKDLDVDVDAQSARIAPTPSTPKSSVQKFQNQFHPEGQKILDALDELGLKRELKFHLGVILDHFEDYEGFKCWVNPIYLAKEKTITEPNELKRYVVVALKREIGVLSAAVPG